MRARQHHEGSVERDGVRIAYEVAGAGRPTVLLMPTWSIVDSRIWKMLVSDLARRYRVVTFDGRGNGRSGRPPDAAAYADAEFVADAVAVFDATGTDRSIVVALSLGGAWLLRLAAEHPDRVAAVFEALSVPFGEPLTERLGHPVPDLHRHLAACDLAIVQGGLTTCMELTAARRPFLYFPLGNHFEQQVHVAHRLDRYGAGRRMDYRTSDADAIAAAAVDQLGRPTAYRPVAADGAARAADLLAGLF